VASIARRQRANPYGDGQTPLDRIATLVSAGSAGASVPDCNDAQSYCRLAACLDRRSLRGASTSVMEPPRPPRTRGRRTVYSLKCPPPVRAGYASCRYWSVFHQLCVHHAALQRRHGDACEVAPASGMLRRYRLADRGRRHEADGLACLIPPGLHHAGGQRQDGRVQNHNVPALSVRPPYPAGHAGHCCTCGSGRGEPPEVGRERAAGRAGVEAADAKVPAASSFPGTEATVVVEQCTLRRALSGADWSAARKSRMA